MLPKLSDKLLTFCNTRKEDTVLNKTAYWPFLFHAFLSLKMKRKEEPPVCAACNATITVKHILIECADLVVVRKKYSKESSLYSLFRNVSTEKMFDYLKEIGMIYKV